MTQFEEFTDASGAVVRYHVLTDETRDAFGGRVTVVGGNAQDVTTGQVLVETDRPGVYVVVPDTDALGVPDAPETDTASDDDFVLGGDDPEDVA